MSTRALLWLKKQGLVLIVFFAFLVTSMLAILQQRTIESQRTLIRQLFQDSLELNQVKMKSVTERHR
jgi:hypothetical protein